MFTGLVAEMGEVISLTKRGGGARLSLGTKTLSAAAALGDSISVNGTCLTVVDVSGGALAFDLSDETLHSSNLGLLRKGERVNLEPSLRLDSRLGGHFVTGHIDGIGTIRTKALTGDICKIVIAADERLTGFLVDKGSVAVDGISL
ncbi:MAG: riboflavin synthase, partial [Nitrospiraceae bacterium]|nr:riboflavin synthase [Nitrospiraceae bacterium]